MGLFKDSIEEIHEKLAELERKEKNDRNALLLLNEKIREIESKYDIKIDKVLHDREMLVDEIHRVHNEIIKLQRKIK